jgi:hypothetical protein
MEDTTMAPCVMYRTLKDVASGVADLSFFNDRDV